MFVSHRVRVPTPLYTCHRFTVIYYNIIVVSSPCHEMRAKHPPFAILSSKSNCFHISFFHNFGANCICKIWGGGHYSLLCSLFVCLTLCFVRICFWFDIYSCHNDRWLLFIFLFLWHLAMICFVKIFLCK